MRAAYHGHITQLAARLQTSEHGLLQATLDMNRDWQAFKAAHLDAQLLLEDRTSWEVDMPAEQMPGDDINDMSGVCSMDAYGQSDFDTADVRTLWLTLTTPLDVTVLASFIYTLPSFACPVFGGRSFRLDGASVDKSKLAMLTSHGVVI